MSSIVWSDMRSRVGVVLKDVAAVAVKEAAGWLFVFKMTLAVVIAMWVSIRFELGQPFTAMVTAFIVMQPQSGMVLMKGVYRALGTVAGMLASLVLFALFPQERELFLLGLSLWVGLCTTGAALSRNLNTYGFVLAGYTAAMIGLPLLPQPASFFVYATNRCTEVMIGIFCAGIVSELIFPQHVGTTIVQAVQGRYTEFVSFVQALFSRGAERPDLERMHLRFIGSVLSLESLRGVARLEATHSHRDDARLRRLNRDFMAASTTLHSLHQLLARLKKTGSPAALPLLSLSEHLAEALVKDGKPPRTAGDASQVARHIAAFRMALPGRVESLHRDLGIEPETSATLDFDTGVELIRRFVLELHDYTRTYAAFPGEDSPEHDHLPFASRSDLTTALLNGVRAMLAVLLVAAFWIVTAWPYGTSALMLVAIVCSLFSTAPDPAQALKWGLLGNAIAFPLAFTLKIFIMPSLSGFGQLCAALIPLLMLGAWWSRSPKTAGMGLGYSCMICFMTTPGNGVQYDPVHMFNYGTALMLGVATGVVVFATFIPATCAWLRRRIPRTMRRQMMMACFAPLSGLSHRFESSTRDLLRTITAMQNARDAHDRHTIDWMFSVLEIGRAVIHLRQGMKAFPWMKEIARVERSIQALAELFRKPTAHNRAAAIEAVEEAIDTMHRLGGENPERVPRDAMHLVKTSLHCIRITLLDDETALSGAVGAPTATQGDALYAA